MKVTACLEGTLVKLSIECEHCGATYNIPDEFMVAPIDFPFRKFTDYVNRMVCVECDTAQQGGPQYET